MQDNCQEFQRPSNRPNLMYDSCCAFFENRSFHVKYKEQRRTKSNTAQWIADTIQIQHPGQTGIIYCATRRQTIELVSDLQVSGFTVLVLIVDRIWNHP